MDHIRRLNLYIGFRALILTGILSSALSFALFDGEWPDQRLLVTIGIFGVLTFLSFLFLRYRTRFSSIATIEQQVTVQIVTDIVLVSTLVELTGGVTGAFPFLYLLLIISGAYLHEGRGNRTACLCATLVFSGLILYEALLPSLGQDQAVSHSFANPTTVVRLLLVLLSFQLVNRLLVYLHHQSQGLRAEVTERTLQYLSLETLNELIINNINSGILFLSGEGAITFANPAASDILGSGLPQLKGRNLWEVLPELASTEAQLVDWLSQQASAYTQRAEVRIGISEEPKILGFSVKPVVVPLDGSTGFLFIFQDLSAVREMEEKIKRADRLAAVGKLSAGIAHEIRNPLASISGSIELLKNELSLDSANERLMEIILREVNRLNTLISDFLLFARPIKVSERKINVSEIVSEIISLFRRGKDVDGRIKIETQLEDDLVISCDSKQLRQVFWNLIKNAIQAMPEGGVLRVSSRWSSLRPKKAEVSVQDSGNGIPYENVSRLFDPFFTTKTEGSGLGLALVYQIVQNHRGDITVQSQPGEGSTFRVVLPAEAHDQVEAPSIEGAAKAAGA